MSVVVLCSSFILSEKEKDGYFSIERLKSAKETHIKDGSVIVSVL